MMLAHMDHCEPPAFVTQIAAATWSMTKAPFTAKPPVASPAETMKRERDQRMMVFFGEALEEAKANGRNAAATSIGNFSRVLQLLPADLPVTDPYISESGSICLDWDDNPASQLSVLIKDDGQIGFAGYFAGESVHGSTNFSGRNLPESLLGTIRRWTRDARANATS